jgi:TRAP-type C4-dicarboxylate transport system permease small subunit
MKDGSPMKSISRVLLWCDDAVAKITLALCGCLLLSMVVIAGLGVIFRFVLHNSLSWSDELEAYLFVWLTCLGAAVGVKMRVHPEIRVLADRCPVALAPWLADLTDCVIGALGAVFLWYGGDMVTLLGGETASSMSMSMVYPYLSIPVCGVLLIFHSLVRIAVSHWAPGLQPAPLAQGISNHL